MNKNLTFNQIVLKIILTLMSSVFIGFGVFFLVYSNKGSDALLTVINGLTKIFNISTGNANLLVNIFLFTIGFLVGRKYMYIGTVVGTFTIGFSIDFWTSILSPYFNTNNTFIVDLFYCVFGILIISFGVAISISLRFGFGPLDSTIFFIMNKTNVSYKYLKIGIDILTICLGAVLGGAIGIGTIISAVLTGPSVELFVKYINKIILRPLKIDDDSNEFKNKSRWFCEYSQ